MWVDGRAIRVAYDPQGFVPYRTDTRTVSGSLNIPQLDRLCTSVEALTGHMRTLFDELSLVRQENAVLRIQAAEWEAVAKRLAADDLG